MMLSKFLSRNVAQRPVLGIARSLSANATKDAPVSKYTVWGESEGNIHGVNWSLVEDGVIPVGNAYRNERVSLLTSHLAEKVTGNKATVKDVAYNGKYTVMEAGDNIDHSAFSDLLSETQSLLSGGQNLYVEDAAIGAFAGERVGVRVITASPSVALIARSLLIPQPHREVDHRARFDGWNMDPRWNAGPEEGDFVDDAWVPAHTADVKTPGQRPIVVFHGGENDKIAIQFAETDDSTIVGASISVGSKAPIRGMIEAIGTASDVIINTRTSDVLSVSGTALTNGTLIINADDSVIDAAKSKNLLYSAYNTILTSNGMSAGWNGIIDKSAKPASGGHRFDIPQIVSDSTVGVVQPDNMMALPKNLVFYEKGGKTGSMTEAAAVAKLVEMSGDEDKAGAITALIKGMKCSSINSAPAM